MKLFTQGIIKPSYFNKNKYVLSRFSILIVGLVIFISNVNSRMWNKGTIIQTDGLAYYAYLPAIFIFDDLKLAYFTQPGPHHEQLTNKAWIVRGPEGQRIIQVSYGVAALYLPFFFIAHGAAHLLDVGPYGYSWPYQMAVQMAALFYLILGLIALRKLLLMYFNDLATSLSILGIVLGTNLFYYATFEPSMSHVYSFFLLSLFTWLLIKWIDKPTFSNSVILGITTGFVVLVRPSNLLIISLFIFWGIVSWKSLGERVLFFFRQFHKILLMIFMSFLIWVPQFLYWKYITGQYVYFSYGENAHFFWNDPQIMNILFSYRKGWLLYTPIMLLAIIGIPYLKNYLKGAIAPISIVLGLYIYVLSCWCFWWFGGGFGSRAFIDMYPLMAIPLAGIIFYYLNSKRIYAKVGFLVIFVLLIAHNLFETAQYRHGAIHYANMTKEAYWTTFGRLKPRGDFYKLLEAPPYDEVKQRIKEAKKGNK